MTTTCVFCHELGVSRTNSCEAFPFLCSQLGVNSVTLLGLEELGVILCESCYSLWEEVTLLYTTMQGINNLMGRRVGQIKQKLRISQDNPGKNGKTRKSIGRSGPEPVDEESMMRWWNPPSTNPVKGQEGVEFQEDVDGLDVKSEPLEFDPLPGDETDDGDGEHDILMGELMEEIEINPEGQSDEDEVSETEEEPHFVLCPTTNSQSAEKSRRNPGAKSMEHPTNRKAIDSDPKVRGSLEITTTDNQIPTNSKNANNAVNYLPLPIYPSSSPTLPTGSMDHSVSDGGAKRKSNRVVDSSLWVKNINKMKRMKGEAYVGSSTMDTPERKVQSTWRPAKSIKETCTSAKCSKSSVRHCEQFTEDVRLEIFHQFWKDMDWGQRKRHVTSLIYIMPKKKRTPQSQRGEPLAYYLKLSGKKVQVCRAMFINTFGLGKAQVGNWVKCSRSGPQPPKVNNGKRPSAAMEVLLKFLQDLPKMPSSHPSGSKSSKLILEPTIKSKMDLYRMYQEHCASINAKFLSRPQLLKAIDKMGIDLYAQASS